MTDSDIYGYPELKGKIIQWQTSMISMKISGMDTDKKKTEKTQSVKFYGTASFYIYHHLLPFYEYFPSLSLRSGLKSAKVLWIRQRRTIHRIIVVIKVSTSVSRQKLS